MAVHVPVREGCETDDSFGVIETDDTRVGYIRIRLLHPPVCANKVHTSDNVDHPHCLACVLNTVDVYLSNTETMGEGNVVLCDARHREAVTQAQR